jgi:hypothetical protein
MAKYAIKHYTRQQSKRKLSDRRFVDAVVPSAEIHEGGFYTTGEYGIGILDQSRLRDISMGFYITLKGPDGTGQGPLAANGATFQFYMAAQGRTGNNCTNTYQYIVPAATGSIPDGSGRFYFTSGTTQWDQYPPSNSNAGSYWGSAAYYKVIVVNSAGSGQSPWIRLDIEYQYNCNCTCPAGYVDACCCYDCNGDGITCCDDPPGNPVSNCCRGACDPGDPGYACGYDCPGGEVCDTCSSFYYPYTINVCS